MSLVLHLGPKRRADAVTVPDPAGLLSWLGSDRATVTFTDLADVQRKAAALDELVRAWIDSLPEIRRDGRGPHPCTTTP